MAEPNFIVPARTWASISAQAYSVREAVGLRDTTYLPIIPLLEALPDLLPNFEFRVMEDVEMSGTLGLTAPDGSFIALPESVYIRACEGSPRDRFTAAHELGHLILHKGTSFQRAATALYSVPPYRLSEPQANFFAATVLVPRHLIHPTHTVGDLMEIFGISQESARLRLDYFRRKGL